MQWEAGLQPADLPSRWLGMQSAPHPSNEAARLASLRATQLLDSPAEEDFDDLVELASICCGMPIALVSLVDESRQWFKARIGVDASETDREIAFCAHAILNAPEILQVPDATADVRFHDNPLVTGDLHLRSYYGAPVHSPDGMPIGTLCVIDRERHVLTEDQLRSLDILARQVEAQIELRRARDEALEAARTRSEFLATMSHEIRTPLGGLLGTLELALDESIEEPLRADLESAHRAGRQLQGLLNSVLDLAKSDAGRLELQPTALDLQELVRGITATYQGAAQAKGLSLAVAIEPSVPREVSLDGSRLTQVLGNLLSNAVKFTEQGEVELHVLRGEGNLVRFEVRDTGIGIGMESRTRLFDRYEQVGGTAGGTGIGLALASELVDLLGGSLGVTSEPGTGTTFAFAIPLREQELLPDRSDTVEIELPPARVLLVDDTPLNLRVGKRTLERLGVQVVTAASGIEALELATAESFDAILLDCFMPDMDGFEVARRLRAHPTVPQRTPILALTASAFGEVRDRCLAVGMDEVLAKPIDRVTLARSLAAALDPLTRVHRAS